MLVPYRWKIIETNIFWSSSSCKNPQKEIDPYFFYQKSWRDWQQKKQKNAKYKKQKTKQKQSTTKNLHKTVLCFSNDDASITICNLSNLSLWASWERLRTREREERGRDIEGEQESCSVAVHPITHSRLDVVEWSRWHWWRTLLRTVKHC